LFAAETQAKSVYLFSYFIFFIAPNVWLAAVPPCVGFAGWLFGGMDSKPLFCDFYSFHWFSTVYTEGSFYQISPNQPKQELRAEPKN